MNEMSDVIRRELAKAVRERMKQRGLSVADIREESGVKCSRPSLHRKLFGYERNGVHVFQSLSDDECRRLARLVGMKFSEARLTEPS